MGRPARAAQRGLVYHTLNRANAQLAIFHDDGDFAAFEQILAEAEQVIGERPVSVFPRGVRVPGDQLGAEPLPKVGFRALSDLAQVAKHPPGLSGHLRQLVRPEDDKRDHGQDQDLGQG